MQALYTKRAVRRLWIRLRFHHKGHEGGSRAGRRKLPHAASFFAHDPARMSQTNRAGVASVRKAMLPKDVMEKLKQIEKILQPPRRSQQFP
jgi:hypothetical protein